MLKYLENYMKLASRKRIDGLSLETRKRLRLYLEGFQEYLSLKEPSYLLLIDFLFQKKIKESTRATMAIQIGKYLKFCNYISENEFESLKQNFRHPIENWSKKGIDPELLPQIIKSAGEFSGTFQNTRNRCLVFLLATLGTRASQLVELNKEDIITKNDLLVFKIKNLKEHRKGLDATYSPKPLPFTYSIGNYNLGNIFTKYCDLANNFSNGAFFLNYKGERLQYYSIKHIVEVISQRLGTPFTPHSFRHYVGTKLAQISLTKASLWLGHQNILTTQRYVNEEFIDYSEFYNV